MGLINAINCNKNFFGTGIGTCEVLLNKQMDGIILVPNSWSLPVTNGNVPLTLANAIELVQLTTFDPLLKAVDFADNTGDPTNQDYSGGISTVVRNAKPTYQLIFEAPLGFHQAAYSKNGRFGQYKALLVFGGFIAGATSPDGSIFTGFDMGMFNVRTLSLPAGDTRMRTLVDFQLIDEDQFNRNMAVLTPDALGFNFSSQVEPIRNTVLNVIATAADPIQVTVTGLSNISYGIEALDYTNFRVVNTVTNAVITTTGSTLGTDPWVYLLTPTTPLVAGTKLTVELYDADVPTNTALVGTNLLLKGKSVEVTVGA